MNKYDKIKLQFLLGTKYEKSILYKINGNNLIIKTIFDIFNNENYIKHINKNETSFYIINDKYQTKYNGKIYPNLRFTYKFPKPKDININMMPIKFPHGIPDEYKEYEPLIYSCPGVFAKYNKIVYLTIHESLVEPNKSHRRPGLHIEIPLKKDHHNGKGNVSNYTKENLNIAYHSTKESEIAWGSGMFVDNTPLDGIYMMSSVSNSCSIYNCKIDNEQDIIKEHGQINHLKEYLGEEVLIKKNQLIWFTDKTPHESLVIDNNKPVYRQFFRLVIGPVSHWYSKHNTPNPLGILPDAIIVDEDKFK